MAAAFSAAALAAPGAPDASFGAGGKVVTQFPSASESSARAVAVQGDGKIVAAGWALVGGSSVIALARYRANGTLDASFGAGGRVTTSAGASSAAANAAAIQSDGKIVVAGEATVGGNRRCMVARFHLDATPDATFGSGGVVTTPLCTSATSIALQPDGKILIAGAFGTTPIVTVRLLPDGPVDTSFSGDGVAVGAAAGTVPPNYTRILAGTGVAVAPDGKVVTVGHTSTRGGLIMATTPLTHRYLPDGAVDTTFGGESGIVSTQVHPSGFPGPFDYATAVAVKPDGRILVAGHGADFYVISELILIGYNVDGTLDTSLAGSGTIKTPVGTGSATADAMVVQQNGKIVLAGRSAGAVGNEFAIVRYLQDGALDSSFGLGGKVTVPFAVTGAASAVALEPAGAIVVAGQANDGGSPSFALVKLEGDDASATMPRLANISTRMQVLTGNDVMIGGFVIGGSASKTVAIVATGPSLAAFGITNALANPTLTLVRSSDQATIATNDDWQGGCPQAGACGTPAQLTAAGFAPTNALEAAIYINLPPGAYTAIVQGANNGTGVAVVGVYEVDAPATPLANISTRGRVLTGNDVMIGGFVIQGSGPQTVAIVATGPSLAQFGIASPLANPTISLVRSSDQAVLATNDDWQNDINASQLQAAGFAPTSALEAGLYRPLAPGAYTVIVQGVGGGTGVAVIGVYKVP